MSLSTFVENEVQIFLDWFSSTALQCTFRQNVGFIRSNLLEFVTDKLTQRVRPSTNLKNVKNAKNWISQMVISLRKERKHTHTNKRYLTFSSASPLASTNFRTKMIIIIITKATFAGPGEPENTATVPFLNEIHLKRKKGKLEKKRRREDAACRFTHSLRPGPGKLKPPGTGAPAQEAVCAEWTKLEQTISNKQTSTKRTAMFRRWKWNDLKLNSFHRFLSMGLSTYLT